MAGWGSMFDRQFDVDVEGLKTVCNVVGSGHPLLMLHGSGPGANAESTWRFIVEHLASRYEIYAPDMIGFGLSQGAPGRPAFQPDLWVKQALAVLERMPKGPVPIVGHSISGFTALRLPGHSSRVAAVVTTGTMGVRYEQSEYTRLTWRSPGNERELRESLEALVFDRARIDDDFVQRRFALLFEKGALQSFDALFPGDKQQYIDACVLTEDEISAIKCPVLLIHGKNDRVIRAEDTTLQIARRMAHADVHLLSQCGHLPATERPKDTSGILKLFLSSNQIGQG